MTRHGLRKYPQKPHDFYPTPDRAFPALLRMLPPGMRYVEPCAGDGAVVAALADHGHRCVWAYDLIPKVSAAGTLCEARDALDVHDHLDLAIVTNPPFSIADVLLRHWFQTNVPVLYLFHPVNWLCNLDWQWAVPHAWRISPIGRLKLKPGSKHQGTTDYVWVEYRPEPRPTGIGTHWVERLPIPRERTKHA